MGRRKGVKKMVLTKLEIKVLYLALSAAEKPEQTQVERDLIDLVRKTLIDDLEETEAERNMQLQMLKQPF